MHAIDDREVPERISSEHRLIMSDSVSVSNPFLTLGLYRIEEHEYTQRVLVERTVQQYQPKWKFALLGSLGAAMAFYAGNTDGFIESRSQKQSLALNTTGTMLAVMAFTNMEPAGDPIHTWEMRFLRSSGQVLQTDTVRVTEGGSREIAADLTIQYGGDLLLDRSFEEADEEDTRIGLTNLLANRTIIGEDPGEFDVQLVQNGEENRFSIPVSSFMKPVVMVTSPIAELRTSPVYDDQPPLAEIGSGSELELIDESLEGWFEVQMGGSNLFIHREEGEIQWREEENIPTVVTVDEVPFGELSVEFAVPVLKTGNTSDIGLVIHNLAGNQLGNRRYIERDHRLMNLYLRDSFGIPQNRILNREISDRYSLFEVIQEVEPDSASTLYTYISGFARITDEGQESTVEMVHVNEHGEEQFVNLEEMLLDLASETPGSLVAFIDLEFQHSYGNSITVSGNRGNSVYRAIANAVSGRNSDSALIFSSRPDQPQGLYESVRHEIKFHHIFPYYIAQAIQQRRTVLSDLVRHIENQVDYTSRRLHDRPQNVQAFGNLSINLAE